MSKMTHTLYRPQQSENKESPKGDFFIQVPSKGRALPRGKVLNHEDLAVSRKVASGSILEAIDSTGQNLLPSSSGDTGDEIASEKRPESTMAQVSLFSLNEVNIPNHELMGSWRLGGQAVGDVEAYTPLRESRRVDRTSLYLKRGVRRGTCAIKSALLKERSLVVYAGGIGRVYEEDWENCSRNTEESNSHPMLTREISFFTHRGGHSLCVTRTPKSIRSQGKKEKSAWPIVLRAWESQVQFREDKGKGFTGPTKFGRQ